jgi:Complex 1 protein (LYR family)
MLNSPKRNRNVQKNRPRAMISFILLHSFFHVVMTIYDAVYGCSSLLRSENTSTTIDLISMPATMAPLVLYRSLLRNAKSMKDYNFRTYAIRRVKTGFIQNRSLQGYVSLQMRLQAMVLVVRFCVLLSSIQEGFRHKYSDSTITLRNSVHFANKTTEMKRPLPSRKE